jgi:hypothetical protein
LIKMVIIKQTQNVQAVAIKKIINLKLCLNGKTNQVKNRSQKLL